jgi:adenylate cyclase
MLFEKAVKLDPRYADAYAMLGWTYSIAVLFQWSHAPQADLKLGSNFAQKALSLDDSNLLALVLVSRNDRMEGRWDQAIADGERAIALDPNDAFAYFMLGEAQILDRPGEGIANIRKAIRLDPESEGFYLVDVGVADVVMGGYQEAAPLLEKYLTVYPNDPLAHSFECIAYAELGREADARAQAADIMRLNPRFTLEQMFKTIRLSKDVEIAKRQKRFDADLREAGLH